MPLHIDLAGTCTEILRQMSDLTKSNYPFLLGPKTGILDFLLNPMNGSIKLDLNNTQQGKKVVKSKLIYKKPTLACQILEDDDVPTTCEPGEEPEESSVDVTITKRIGTPVRTFDNAKMVNICQDTKSFIMEYVGSDMKALREKAASFLITSADAAAGVNHKFDGNDAAAGATTDVELLTPNSGVLFPNFANFTTVKLDYINNHFNEYPHLVGQGNLQYFYELAKWTCCNAPGVGYDAAIAQSGAAFYLDQQANSAMAANEFLSFAPNVAHLLWFNENHNININEVDRVHTVISDPVYPQLKYDFDFWFDCKKWHYKLSTWLDFFAAIQDDSFGDEASPSPGCESDLIGVNGIFKYRATQGS
jgi:hypothetical protein